MSMPPALCFCGYLCLCYLSLMARRSPAVSHVLYVVLCSHHFLSFSTYFLPLSFPTLPYIPLIILSVPLYVNIFLKPDF